MTVTASIGIAVGDRTTGDELLRDADIAMYRAKWDGKNRYAVFVRRDAGTACRSAWSWSMDLREALARATSSSSPTSRRSR